MKGAFFFLLASVLTLDLYGQKKESDSLKCWDSNNKLTWADFKGTVEPSSMFSAVCPSNIKAYPVKFTDSTYTYKVRVAFHRYHAWTRTKDESSLAHEQLHFDITELYARKLRKKIKEEFKGWYDDDLGVMINGLIAESSEQQTVYDEKTIHGAYKEGQEEWSKKIHSELDQLKEYSSTSTDCTQ